MSAQELLRLAILVDLRGSPTFGYDLIRRLGQLAPPPATVYRALRGLEAEGLLASWWHPPERGPARRLYETTRAGEEYLVDRRKALHDHVTTLRAMLGKIPRSPSGSGTG